MVSVATCVVSMSMLLTSVPFRNVFVAEGVALVIGRDGAEVSVGIVDLNDRRIVPLDLDRGGSARVGNLKWTPEIGPNVKV